MYNSNELTMYDLEKKAPSIFAENPYGGVSDKYSFLQTTKMIDVIMDHGWHPVDAFEQKVRKEEYKGYQKHLIRFQNHKLLAEDGELRPELLCINSHNAAASHIVKVGMFRLVCSNGLISGDTAMETRVRHVGWTMEDVNEGIKHVVDSVPAMFDQVYQMKKVFVDREEQYVLAKSALDIRYGDKHKPVSEDRLLRTRRYADQNNDLWSIFNTIQENVIKGRLLGLNEKGKRTTTRAVKAIDASVDFNTKFWMVALEMARRLG